MEDQIFVAAFLKSPGSIKEMEQVFGISYPTVKARLNRIAGQLEFVDTAPVAPRNEVSPDRLSRERNQRPRRHPAIGGKMTVEILPPLAASVRVQPRGWKYPIRLWLPLFLVWLLLIPLLLLILPLFLVACLIFGIRFWRSLAAIFGVVAATRGTNVEVERPSARVFIKLH